MSRLTRAGWPSLYLSREAKFSDAKGDREKTIFPCSADHEQNWQPYTVHPYYYITTLAKCHDDDHTVHDILDYWCSYAFYLDYI